MLVRQHHNTTTPQRHNLLPCLYDWLLPLLTRQPPPSLWHSNRKSWRRCQAHKEVHIGLGGVIFDAFLRGRSAAKIGTECLALCIIEMRASRLIYIIIRYETPSCCCPFSPMTKRTCSGLSGPFLCPLPPRLGRTRRPRSRRCPSCLRGCPLSLWLLRQHPQDREDHQLQPLKTESIYLELDSAASVDVGSLLQKWESECLGISRPRTRRLPATAPSFFLPRPLPQPLRQQPQLQQRLLSLRSLLVARYHGGSLLL